MEQASTRDRHVEVNIETEVCHHPEKNRHVAHIHSKGRRKSAVRVEVACPDDLIVQTLASLGRSLPTPPLVLVLAATT